MYRTVFIFFFAAILSITSSLIAAELSRGEGIYLKYCVSCHGSEGNGQGFRGHTLSTQPRDFTSFDSKENLKQQQMIHSITEGMPGTAMVPWGGMLSKEEIEDVTAFITQSFMQMDRRLLAGKTLYIKNCSPCHGDDGNSARWTKNSLNPAPRNFTTAKAKRELSRERMIESVTRGRPGTAMMPFTTRLDKEEIANVVDYIRASFMSKNTTATAPIATALSQPTAKKTVAGQFDVSRHLSGIGKTDMTMAFPKGLQGDFANGRRFFMKNCFTCHGKEGNGQGPRAKFIFPKPRNFHSQESKTYLNRPALFLAIYRGKQGTVMPAWGRVLDDQQIADVAEFVFQAFIQEKGVALPSSESLGWKKKQP